MISPRIMQAICDDVFALRKIMKPCTLGLREQLPLRFQDAEVDALNKSPLGKTQLHDLSFRRNDSTVKMAASLSLRWKFIDIYGIRIARLRIS